MEPQISAPKIPPFLCWIVCHRTVYIKIEYIHQNNQCGLLTQVRLGLHSLLYIYWTKWKGFDRSLFLPGSTCRVVPCLLLQRLLSVNLYTKKNKFKLQSWTQHVPNPNPNSNPKSFIWNKYWSNCCWSKSLGHHWKCFMRGYPFNSFTAVMKSPSGVFALILFSMAIFSVKVWLHHWGSVYIKQM